jgi:hypothetical protein
MFKFLLSFKINSYIQRINEHDSTVAKLDDTRNTVVFIFLFAGMLGLNLNHLLKQSSDLSNLFYITLMILPVVYCLFRIHVNHVTDKMLKTKTSSEIIDELEELKRKSNLVAEIEKEQEHLETLISNIPIKKVKRQKI